MKTLAAFGAMKVSRYLIEFDRQDIIEKYQGLLTKEVSMEEFAMLQEMEQYPDMDHNSAPINVLTQFCGNNKIALTFIQLCALYYMNPIVGDVFSQIDTNCVGGVSLILAAKVASYKGEIFDYMTELQDAYSRLEILYLYPECSKDPFREVVSLDARLVNWLMHGQEIDKEISDYCQLSEVKQDEKIYGFQSEVNYIASKLRKNSSPVTVLISGLKESGRYTIAKHAARLAGYQLITVDYMYLTKTEKPKHILRKIIRECIITNRCLCVRDVLRSENTEFLIRQIERIYTKYINLPLVLLTRTEVKLVPFINSNIITTSIGKCKANQIYEIWKGFLEAAGMDGDIQISELASKMNLTAGQIKRIVDLLRTESESNDIDGIDKDKLIYRLCYQVLDDGRYDNVKRVASGFKLEDVKINERNKNVLLDICNQVIYRQKVYGDWRMSEKYAYGRCVSAIFAGPPGTGKTMAVHALASELGLELYKVDLSQIVDKYIGETQKRLEEVFTRAEKSNMILFFDEADAIMGKRNEVKDSHDKYANTEIAYILQRMEEYDGIVILATNYLQNIDSAFMRRIRYVVSFEIPDEETRKEIWHSAFAEGVPLSEDLDFEYLSKQFEFAGGQIKNIVLNATFYAASENQPVSMRHMVHAISLDLMKDKNLTFIAELGEYAYLA